MHEDAFMRVRSMIWNLDYGMVPQTMLMDRDQ